MDGGSYTERVVVLEGDIVLTYIPLHHHLARVEVVVGEVGERLSDWIVIHVDRAVTCVTNALPHVGVGVLDTW